MSLSESNSYFSSNAGTNPATFNMISPDTIIQGAWSYSNPNLTNGGGGADGDAVDWKATLVSGTYTLYVYAAQNNTQGIMTISVNGTDIATFDCYSAGSGTTLFTATPTLNIPVNISSVKMRVNGKNAASGGYQLLVQRIWLVRTL